ncbi:TPA: hypothetical protein ACK3Q6_005505 [Burkholderia cepacia]|jgi:hypothetical protein|uniref:Uncharacterized protein n=2 Tax=Burkholderia cepacia complex TaxID=87882 RepID=A0A250LP00_9BURK|nr:MULTISPECIES: hypothetical protein [Burkholderia]HDR9763042.1 hypothetical protein [Burkholderia cepacia ATCC 25416]HDV6371568.1 hypothetical protein [Burkholderia cepacia]MBR8291241.1 hypothetical protein [Burkholderia cenocepacia]MBX3827617.1 hypothetical protein [Burkholderia contaminans]MBX3846181.1 hypothetical protein [Burkholderia contaminans]
MQSQPLRHIVAKVTRNVRSVLQPAFRVYHFLMEKFIAANGREVLKTVTKSGATGYMDASIPAEAIPSWRMQIAAARARNLSELSRVIEDTDGNSSASPAV